MIPFVSGQRVYDELARLGLAQNTFDDLVDHGRSLVASPIMIVDEFEDSAGIDAANSTGETLDVSGFVSNPAVNQQTWSRAMSLGDSGQENYSYRVVLSAADISTDGAAITLTLKASPSAGLDVDNVSIVERDGATANGVEVPTEVLFSGASGFSISAGQTITSDVTAFSIDETKDYLAIVDMAATNGNPQYVDTGTAYWLAGTDSYNVASGAGFGGPFTRTFAVTALNVVADAPALDLWSVGVEMLAGPTSGFFVGHFSESDPDTIYCSNDDGVTWDAVTLTDYGDYGSGVSVFAGPVALTGGGTDVRLRAAKAAGAECRVEAWCGVFGNA